MRNDRLGQPGDQCRRCGQIVAGGAEERGLYLIRSNGLLDLWGHKTILDQAHTYQYVTAIISVRAKQLRVLTRHGEIIHAAPFDIDRQLR